MYPCKCTTSNPAYRVQVGTTIDTLNYEYLWYYETIITDL